LLAGRARAPTFSVKSLSWLLPQRWLRRRQADPRRLAHGLNHVIDQCVEVFVEFRKCMSLAAQYGLGEGNDLS
jgi:hypothetical protein